jgi:hypothetical protein
MLMEINGSSCTQGRRKDGGSEYVFQAENERLRQTVRTG